MNIPGSKVYDWKELNDGDNILLNSVGPGSYSASRLQNLLENPEEKRSGLVLKKGYLMSDKLYICIVFDIPYNNDLQSTEKEFLAFYPVDAPFDLSKHIFLIPCTLWPSQKIVLSKLEKLSKQSLVKCSVPKCNQVCCRYQLVHLCENHHHNCCHSHFSATNEEELLWVDDVRDVILRVSKTPPEYLEMGVRYLFFAKMNFPELEIKQLMSFVIEASSYVCPICCGRNKSLNIHSLDMLNFQIQNPMGYIEQIDQPEVENEDYEMIDRTELNDQDETSDEDNIVYTQVKQISKERAKSEPLRQSKDTMDQKEPPKPFFEDRAKQLSARNNYLQNHQTKTTSNAPNISENESRMTEKNSEKIPFRDTFLFNSLKTATKTRLISWEQELILTNLAKPDEIEQIYSTQSKEELEDMTFQVLKILLYSARDKKQSEKKDTRPSSSSSVPSSSKSLSTGMGMGSMSGPSSSRYTVTPSPSRIRGPRYPFELKIIRPEDPERVKTLRITSDLTYDEVLKEACELFKLYFQWKDMCLVKRDVLGWNIKIYPEIHNSNLTTINPQENNKIKLWGLLETTDILELRRTKGAFLGGRFYLKEIMLMDKFNQSIKQKVRQLNENYLGYREIRGDGNCYYRAVFCGIVERIITSAPFAEYGGTISPKPSRLSLDSLSSAWSLSNATSQKALLPREKAFQFLCEKFSSLIRPGRPTVNHSGLLQALHAASRNDRWLTVEEFERDILDESSGLDEASISDCKRLVTQFILDNKNKEFNGLSLENAILFTNEKYKKLSDYCNEEILKMEICAEGAFVELGILPSLLGAKCEVIFLDREEANQLNIRQTNGIAMEKIITEISLLFRPGHYDLLYKRDTPLTKEEMDAAIKLEDETYFPSEKDTDKLLTTTTTMMTTTIPVGESKKGIAMETASSKSMENDSPNLSLNHQQLAEKALADRARAMKMLNEKASTVDGLPLPPAPNQVSAKSQPQPQPQPQQQLGPFSLAGQAALTKSISVESSATSTKKVEEKEEKKEEAILNPRLTQQEMDDLINLVGEHDFDFRLQRFALRSLLEMGFSIQILLDTWIKFRSKLKSVATTSTDWLDLIEATKQEQEQKPQSTSTATEHSQQQQKSSVLPPVPPPVLAPDRPVVSRGINSNNSSNHDMNSSVDSATSSKPYSLERQKSSSSQSREEARKKNDSLSKEDRDRIHEWKKEKFYFLTDSSCHRIHQLVIELRHDYQLPLENIFLVVEKDPFCEDKEKLVSQISRLPLPSSNYYELPASIAAGNGNNNIVAGNGEMKVSPNLRPPALDQLTNDQSYLPPGVPQILKTPPSMVSSALVDTSANRSKSPKEKRKAFQGYLGNGEEDNESVFVGPFVTADRKQQLESSQINGKAVNQPEPAEKGDIKEVKGITQPPSLLPASPEKPLSKSQQQQSRSEVQRFKEKEKEIQQQRLLAQQQASSSTTSKFLSSLHQRGLHNNDQSPKEEEGESPRRRSDLAGTDSPSRVSALVHQFNSKAPSSSTSSPSISSIQRKQISSSSSLPPLPPATTAPVTSSEAIDDYFFLYQMKDRYPTLRWDVAERNIRILYEKYEVSMKLLLDAVIKSACLLDDSIQEYAEKQLGRPLALRSSSTTAANNNHNNNSNINGDGNSDGVMNSPFHLSIAIPSQSMSFSMSNSSSNYHPSKQHLSPNNDSNQNYSNPPTQDHPHDDQQSSMNLHPLNLLYRKFQDIYNYLVEDINLPAEYVKNAIEDYGCKNIRACIIAIRILSRRKTRPWISELLPRDDDISLDKRMKEMIFKTTVDFGYNIDEVLDAIAFDKCWVISDIIDAIESRQLREEREQKKKLGNNNQNNHNPSSEKKLEEIEELFSSLNSWSLENFRLVPDENDAEEEQEQEQEHEGNQEVEEAKKLSAKDYANSLHSSPSTTSRPPRPSGIPLPSSSSIARNSLDNNRRGSGDYHHLEQKIHHSLSSSSTSPPSNPRPVSSRPAGTTGKGAKKKEISLKDVGNYIKTLSRENVTKTLKQFNLLEEKNQGLATKHLREMLLQHMKNDLQFKR